jgi:transcription-repair coupling factor (superfamily II helicase)
MLGAGFKIAMRDLEIRGAGNILGAEQSGHIAAVGYEMYCRLLEESVRELKSEPKVQASSATSIEIGLSASIPRAYIPSEQRRLEAYRRLAAAGTLEQLKTVRADLTAAYGDPPRASYRLFDLCELRIMTMGLGVKTITVREKDVVFLTENPAPVVAKLSNVPAGSQTAKEATVRSLPPKEPGHPHEVYFRPPENYMDPETLLRVLRKRLG